MVRDTHGGVTDDGDAEHNGRRPNAASPLSSSITAVFPQLPSGRLFIISHASLSHYPQLPVDVVQINRKLYLASQSCTRVLALATMATSQLRVSGAG